MEQCEKWRFVYWRNASKLQCKRTLACKLFMLLTKKWWLKIQPLQCNSKNCWCTFIDSGLAIQSMPHVARNESIICPKKYLISKNPCQMNLGTDKQSYTSCIFVITHNVPLYGLRMAHDSCFYRCFYIRHKQANVLAQGQHLTNGYTMSRRVNVKSWELAQDSIPEKYAKVHAVSFRIPNSGFDNLEFSSGTIVTMHSSIERRKLYSWPIQASITRSRISCCCSCKKTFLF